MLRKVERTVTLNWGGDKETKDKKDLFYHSHVIMEQHKDEFDIETIVEELYWPIWKFMDELDHWDKVEGPK